MSVWATGHGLTGVLFAESCCVVLCPGDDVVVYLYDKSINFILYFVACSLRRAHQKNFQVFSEQAPTLKKIKNGAEPRVSYMTVRS